MNALTAAWASQRRWLYRPRLPRMHLGMRQDIGFELTCEGELGGTFQNPKDALRN